MWCTGVELLCSEQADTILVHPNLGLCKSMDVLPLDRMVVSNDIWIPYNLKNERMVRLNETAKGTIAFGETMFRWSVPNITNVCKDCKIGGIPCGFRSEAKQAFCKKHTMTESNSFLSCLQDHMSKSLQMSTSSVATILFLSVIVAAALYLTLKSKYDEEIHLKVEMFLNTYSTSKPTRYTFSEVKKITRRFNNKLGQVDLEAYTKVSYPMEYLWQSKCCRTLREKEKNLSTKLQPLEQSTMPMLSGF
ncbi:Rust resistance kinase Lr10 [Dichanthelium oligosanthes]|uniref:Rust resistance kinase Lr10 n=1 Tax=Dichanthelium oligosanthes TaxID=888268 RepID=A0A1E5VU84_9POAL|nr:Rust resistance kinase Lr10 [Dichanthelium oligosanthes]